MKPHKTDPPGLYNNALLITLPPACPLLLRLRPYRMIAWGKLVDFEKCLDRYVGALGVLGMVQNH